MSDQGTADDDRIQRVSVFEGIRRRPHLFTGGPDQQPDPHDLVTEAVCLACENARAQRASQIQVVLRSSGEVEIEDNGPGLDVNKRLSETESLIQSVFTRLYACRDATPRLPDRNLCRAGMVVVTALSKWITYETAQSGFLWRQTFRPDSSHSPLEKLTPTTACWQRVTFQPDAAIFAAQHVTLTGVCSVLRNSLGEAGDHQPPLPVAALSLRVADQSSGEIITWNWPDSQHH